MGQGKTAPKGRRQLLTSTLTSYSRGEETYLLRPDISPPTRPPGSAAPAAVLNWRGFLFCAIIWRPLPFLLRANFAWSFLHHSSALTSQTLPPDAPLFRRAAVIYTACLVTYLRVFPSPPCAAIFSVPLGRATSPPRPCTACMATFAARQRQRHSSSLRPLVPWVFDVILNTLSKNRDGGVDDAVEGVGGSS